MQKRNSFLQTNLKWLLLSAVGTACVALAVSGIRSCAVKKMRVQTEPLPPTMVQIPGGSYSYGCRGDSLCEVDEGSDDDFESDVTLESFSMDINEVTNGEYADCVDAGACKDNADGECMTRLADGRPWPKPAAAIVQSLFAPDRPAVCVSWREAAAYCGWAKKKLPSEPQWEVAAGGSEDRTFPWGEDPPAGGSTGRRLLSRHSYLEGLANHGGLVYNGAEPADGFAASAPPGSFPDGASPHGVNDMAGNVWEWTANCYDSDIDDTNCPRRAVRGGSFRSSLQELRITNRFGLPPEKRYDDVGFRCAR